MSRHNIVTKHRVHRFVGWVFSMVGVGIIMAWLTFPIELADRVDEGLIPAAVLLAIARKLYSVATHHRPSTHERSGAFSDPLPSDDCATRRASHR